LAASVRVPAMETAGRENGVEGVREKEGKKRKRDRELKRVEEGRDQDHEVADCFSARPN